MRPALKPIIGFSLLIISAVITLGLLFTDLTEKSFYNETGNVEVEGITSKIEIYKDRFESGFQSVTKALMDYLSGWLVTHITVSDRAYLETLKEGGVK